MHIIIQSDHAAVKLIKFQTVVIPFIRGRKLKNREMNSKVPYAFRKLIHFELNSYVCNKSWENKIHSFSRSNTIFLVYSRI